MTRDGKAGQTVWIGPQPSSKNRKADSPFQPA